MRRGFFLANQRVDEARRALDTREPCRKRNDEEGEADEQEDLGAELGTVLGVEERKRENGPELAEGAGGQNELTEGREGLAGVAQDRDDESERRRGDDDRHEDGLVVVVEELDDDTGDDREHRRAGVRTHDAADASRIAPTSSSRPARNNKNDRPMSARTVTGTSTSTQPRPDGPTMIPSTISMTTAGIRNRGASDTSSGAANAIAATARKDVKDRLPMAVV